MLRLFSKLKISILKEGKVREFLLYTVAEMVLVVVGILIALQIDNWNQETLENETEQEYLSRLHTELTQDSIQYAKAAEIILSLRKNALYINQVLTDPSHSIDDSLKFLNGIRGMISNDIDLPTPVVWSELISSGNLKLIRDKDLITKLYAYYQKIEANEDDFNDNTFYYILGARRIDARIFTINDQLDYFDNYRKDTVSEKSVFIELLNDPELKHMAKGIGTGLILSYNSLRPLRNQNLELLQELEARL